MSKRFSLHSVSRDITAVTTAVSILVTENLLSGTAQHWTVGVLAAVNAAILALTTPNSKTDQAPLVSKTNP